MKVQVKIPVVGESITEVTISSWLKNTGDFVKQGENILALETDKANVEIAADASGTLATLVNPGEIVRVGTTVAEIDTEAVAKPAPPRSPPPPPKVDAAVFSEPPKPASSDSNLGPAVRKLVAEKNINVETIVGTGKDGRVTKGDILAPKSPPPPAKPAPAAAAKLHVLPTSQPSIDRFGPSRRVPMTNLRKKIAERLVQAQHNAAILTTFNEIDMSKVMELRAKYKDKFKEKYGVGLGFMGFFTKAVVEALKNIPQLNAYIDGTDIVYHDYYHIGVAVGTEKGLIVPVIRNADQKPIHEVEKDIKAYGDKAREGKITVDDLAGGTFTISNGGVYGSLMSTPILNPPQSGILGMHKIQERPMVVGKSIEIRPMMYVALSYDHRIIDGKEAVTFLVEVKNCIEDPDRLLLEI